MMKKRTRIEEDEDCEDDEDNNSDEGQSRVGCLIWDRSASSGYHQGRLLGVALQWLSIQRRLVRQEGNGGFTHTSRV